MTEPRKFVSACKFEDARPVAVVAFDLNCVRAFVTASLIAAQLPDEVKISRVRTWFAHIHSIQLTQPSVVHLPQTCPLRAAMERWISPLPQASHGTTPVAATRFFLLQPCASRHSRTLPLWATINL